VNTSSAWIVIKVGQIEISKKRKKKEEEKTSDET
jgi:hypothetical protein